MIGFQPPGTAVTDLAIRNVSGVAFSFGGAAWVVLTAFRIGGKLVW
jgi:hypothetical protein